jgi:hypothetical protein
MIWDTEEMHKNFCTKYLDVANFISKNEDIKMDCMEMSYENGTGIMSSDRVRYYWWCTFDLYYHRIK